MLFTPSIITNRNSLHSLNGTNAVFAYPMSIAVDKQGNVWVSDCESVNPMTVMKHGKGPSGEDPVSGLFFPERAFRNAPNQRIRLIVPSGEVTTVADNEMSIVAGTFKGVGRLDGLGHVARFMMPAAIAAGPDGCLYVADNGNAVIRKIRVLSEKEIRKDRGDAGVPHPHPLSSGVSKNFG
eukprot:jgi/Bigna1/144615/aug1.89_g19323